MEIHSKFSIWLSAAKIQPVDETVRKWWPAIDGFSANRADVVNLARMARQESAEPEFEAKFTAAIQSADAAFLPTDRVALAVLAAARLHIILENDKGVLGEFTALLIAVAYPKSESHAAYLADLVTLAHSSVAGSCRSRANWSYLQDGPGPQNDAAKQIELLRRALAVCSEETNMLWWLFGETSRDLDKRFALIDEGALALIAGKELADLTLIVPGPVAIAAFADRVCRSGRAKPADQINLAAAVLELPDTWRKDIATVWTAQPYLPLCRVATAVTRSLDVTAAKWPAKFAEATGWPKAHKLPPAQAARQFYLECLVPKAWSRAKP